MPFDGGWTGRGARGLRASRWAATALLVALLGSSWAAHAHTEELLLENLPSGAVLVRPISRCSCPKQAAAKPPLCRSSWHASCPDDSRTCWSINWLQAHFEFSSSVPLAARHAGTFPAPLLSLARQHGVQQLELSLTQGRWVSAAACRQAAPLPAPTCGLNCHVSVVHWGHL